MTLVEVRHKLGLYAPEWQNPQFSCAKAFFTGFVPLTRRS